MGGPGSTPILDPSELERGAFEVGTWNGQRLFLDERAAERVRAALAPGHSSSTEEVILVSANVQLQPRRKYCAVLIHRLDQALVLPLRG